jgi:uncharacterized protein with ParB-like and HNH nuclease domain
MNGRESDLVSILKSADKLIIPVYQRNYDWKETHCQTLFNDLEKTIKNNRKTHFFGGIVSVNDPVGGRADYLIIDGQQRLTTVTLLLLALAKLLQEGKVQSDDRILADTIIKKYLADEIDPQKRKIKLKPIKGDSDAFERLWRDPEEYTLSSNVTMNYMYFYNRIQKGELTASQLFEAVQRLQVIDITLKMPDDDPQLVFESLNSTGLDLNEGDKIRNYILMGLPIDKQEKFYNDYWNPIEKKAGYDKDSNSFNVSWFIRDYLSIKQRKIPSINSVYISFKEYATNRFHDSDLETLLHDVLGYARRYEKLLNGFSDFPTLLNASISRLNRFESSVTRPFLMEVLHLKEQGLLSDENTIDVFRAVEAYLFRRIICDLPSSALNKVFLTLANDVYRIDETWDNFINKMKYVLASKKEKARFPDDSEFAEGLQHKNIFIMPPRYKAYLFERFENGNILEHKSVYDLLDNGTYTIEHIMPQTLSTEWQENLGADFENTHEKWLHRLANITLSAYNSKYKNYSFEKKRTMKDGYLDSGLRMNQYIARNTKWGVEELEERAEYLKKQAYELWPFVKTDYAPPEKQFDEYTLDDDFTFTNKIIVKYRFNGIEHEVENWTEMYISVLQTLHERNKTILNYLADADDSVELAIHISRTETDFIKSAKIDERLYLWINTSTQYKINLLQKFFTIYGSEPENLVFVIKESHVTSENTEGRFAQRQNFWAQAIPSIRAASGMFINANPSKGSSIRETSGHSGIYYFCIANFDSVRIELRLCNSDKSVNKAIFTILEQQFEMMNSEYGSELNWKRTDDIKACRIYDQLEGLSIADETNWPRMIEFLSKHIGKLKSVCQHRIEYAVSTAITEGDYKER